MLELNGDNLMFSFPDVHPCAKVSIAFQRTLRIPDDGKTYNLPPGLGTFPVRHVEDFSKRLPEKWKKRGGVMLPMYQSEALWINFHGNYDPSTGQQYPFAIKVSAGKQSALTGKPWSKKLKEKDYCIVPLQPWLDGYVVEDGFIKQFVAMPLGGGFTVEEQLTGKAEFGGIQIEAIPMKRAEYDKRFPKLPPRPAAAATRSVNYGSSGGFKLGGYGPPGVFTSVLSKCALSDSRGFEEISEMDSMGLGAGGRMKQQVFEDPYGLSEWDTSNKTRCFVHLANSMTWRAITGDNPPTTPMTAEDYTRYHMPWFDYYSDAPALKGTEKLKGIKTVKEIGKQKGVPALPENTSVNPHNVVIIPSRPHGKQVKDGTWK